MATSSGSSVCESVDSKWPPSTAKSTANPTAKSTANPTAKSTANPTAKSTSNPTAKSTAKSTANPTANPTAKSTVSSSLQSVLRCPNLPLSCVSQFDLMQHILDTNLQWKHLLS